MGFELHGRSELILSSGGELSSDRYGTWSGRCVFTFPEARWDLVPPQNAVHPYAPWAIGEKQTVQFTPGLWTLIMEYADTPMESTPPVHELRRGTGQEPIETNPKFISDIAGTPSAPKNGALFVDEEGLPTADDDRGVFHAFRLAIDGARNPFAGLNAYLALNNTVWSRSWTQRAKPTASDNVGKIAVPKGGAPNYGGHYNWLALGLDATERGAAWACNEQWMLSGPAGFNPTVY